MEEDYFLVKCSGEEFRTDRAGAYDIYSQHGSEDITIELHRKNGWVEVGHSMWWVVNKKGESFYGLATTHSYKT